MRKVFISINDCIPGMQIAEDIFNEYGSVIITEGVVFDEHLIRRIEELGIEKIKVLDIKGDIIPVSSKELFKAQYNENLNTVKTILHSISTGKEINMKIVDKATDSIITRINENSSIVHSINEMRNADDYVYTHSINVSLLAMLIGKWLRYDYNRIKSLVYAGFLHDIGKGKISPDILNKPEALSIEEFEEMKKHSLYGFKIAEKMPGLDYGIRRGILMHHEREDGSGYPYGLKGEQIHDYAKIIAVADIYDAMTSNRSYRNKICPFDVIEHMEKNNFETLDHRVISVFLKNIAAYYIGYKVMLSTGDIGEIVYINPFNVSKPIVKTGNAFIDLSAKKGIKIIEIT